MEKKKIILDTCVIIGIVGTLKKASPRLFEKMDNYQKLVHLADQGLVEFYATPQIFKELTNPNFYNPNKKDSALNYFIKNYLNLLTFDEKETQLIDHLAKKFGTKILTSGGTVFTLAQKQGDRNFADCRIYSECTTANLPIVTDNLKDFKNYKSSREILNALKIQNFSKVYSIDEMLSEIKFDNSYYKKLNLLEQTL